MAMRPPFSARSPGSFSGVHSSAMHFNGIGIDVFARSSANSSASLPDRPLLFSSGASSLILQPPKPRFPDFAGAPRFCDLTDSPLRFGAFIFFERRRRGREDCCLPAPGRQRCHGVDVDWLVVAGLDLDDNLLSARCRNNRKDKHGGQIDRRLRCKCFRLHEGSQPARKRFHRKRRQFKPVKRDRGPPGWRWSCWRRMLFVFGRTRTVGWLFEFLVAGVGSRSPA